MPAKLSIIVVAYNLEKYIESCLASIYSQKRIDECEVIIVNDGSTDETLQRITAFCSNSSHQPVIINQKNVGVSETRNNGINIANGEFIWLVDGDDKIADNAVDYVLSSLKSSLDAIKFGYSTLTYANNVWEINGNFGVSKSNKKVTGHYISKKIFLGQITPSAWTIIVKKDIVELHQLIFKKYKNAEDMLWVYSVLKFVKNAKVIDHPLYVYRQRHGSTSYTMSEKHISDIFNVLGEISNDVIERRLQLYFTVLSVAQIVRLFKAIEKYGDSTHFDLFSYYLKEFFTSNEICRIYKKNWSPFVIENLDTLIVMLDSYNKKDVIQTLIKLFEVKNYPSENYNTFIRKNNNLLKRVSSKWRLFLDF